MYSRIIHIYMQYSLCLSAHQSLPVQFSVCKIQILSQIIQNLLSNWPCLWLPNEALRDHSNPSSKCRLYSNKHRVLISKVSKCINHSICCGGLDSNPHASPIFLPDSKRNVSSSWLGVCQDSGKRLPFFYFSIFFPDFG